MNVKTEKGIASEQMECIDIRDDEGIYSEEEEDIDTKEYKDVDIKEWGINCNVLWNIR